MSGAWWLFTAEFPRFVFFMQIHPLQHNWALQNGFCFFLQLLLYFSLNTQENFTQWYMFFSYSQRTRLQKDFVFWGEMLNQGFKIMYNRGITRFGFTKGCWFFWFMLDWTLLKWFEFSLKKLKNTWTTLWSISKWFSIYFLDWVLACQNGFVFSWKQR